MSEKLLRRVWPVKSQDGGAETQGPPRGGGGVDSLLIPQQDQPVRPDRIH